MLFSFLQKERKEGKKSWDLTENICWRAFPTPCPFMAEIALFPLCGLHLPLPRLEERDHFGQATCPCIPGPPPAGDRANFCLGGQGCQAVGEDTRNATVILLFPINPSRHGNKHFPWHITAWLIFSAKDQSKRKIPGRCCHSVMAPTQYSRP